MSINDIAAGRAVTKAEKKRRIMNVAAPVLLSKFYRVHTSIKYQNLPKTLKNRDEYLVNFVVLFLSDG
jgi:hypothetical protein